MEGSLKSRSPRERETARPVLVPRAVLMMRQQRCISTRPPLPSTRARSLSSPGLWSARMHSRAHRWMSIPRKVFLTGPLVHAKPAVLATCRPPYS